MYYIYHIPNVKIGVSKNPKSRVENQEYVNFEILEEHTDIVSVSKREKELQRQYGYRVDRPDYSSTCEIGLTGARSKSKAKVEAGRQNIKIATEASKRRIICLHCGKDSNTGNYKRWHGENCKHK